MGNGMARALNRLSAKAVDNLKRRGPSGYFADGGGLLLQVSAPGSASWVFRYQRNGRRRELGLGSALNVPLALARTKAEAMRAQLGQGIEPQSPRDAARAAAVGRLTFDQCAERFIATRRHEWKNEKHAAQWAATLAAYASPLIGKLDVAEIDTHHIMSVIEPIWTKKPETASRVRGRIESVLAWATISRLRTGDNPARWRGHLDALLPKPTKVRRVEHHPALPYERVPDFVRHLRQIDGMGARALEFAVLTAARSGEVRGATWDEIDLKARVWVVPGERMKAGKEHRVPLSEAAADLLKALPRCDGDHFVFPAPRGGELSDATLKAAIVRMHESESKAEREGYLDPTQGKIITPHGFRSAFRDWAGETTAHAREVIEHALAHRLKDKAEAAYQRGTLLEKRAALMRDWSAHCLKTCTKR